MAVQASGRASPSAPGRKIPQTKQTRRNYRDPAGFFASCAMEVIVAIGKANAQQFASSDAFVATDAVYRPRNPEENPLYGVVAGHLETFLARQRDRDRNVPQFVEREFRSFLNCGVVSRGFIRV